VPIDPGFPPDRPEPLPPLTRHPRVDARTSIGTVHLRRALLLFAIVLGVAALAASFSRPDDDDGEQVATPPPAQRTSPEANPGSGGVDGVELRFDASKPRTRRLEVGVPATVFVEVEEAGLVEIEGLGRSDPAAPLTPARFDLLVSRAGRYPIRFTPAGEGDTREGGTLAVVEPEG
jgi:hypothetical protein